MLILTGNTLKKTALLILSLVFQFTFSNAQTENIKLLKKDAKPQSHKEIDTLIEYLKRDYYNSRGIENTITNGKYLIQKAKEVGYNNGVFNVTSFVGNALLKLNDTIAAIKLFKEELKEAIIRKDSATIIGYSIDLGNVYNVQGARKKAIDTYKAILPFSAKAKDTMRLFILNSNIADIYIDIEDVENAAFYNEAAGRYVLNLNAKYYKAGQKYQEAQVLYLQNNLKEAIIYFKKAIELAEPINFKDVIIKSTNYCALAYAKIGNYEEAYKYQEKVALFKEEKYNKDKIEALENVIANYNNEQLKQDLEKKELENKLIEQEAAKNESRLIWVSIGSFALLLFLISLLYSYLKRKKLLQDLKEKNIEYLQAKEESEELANAKSLFFSNMSHELRTPLYGIIGLSSILMEDKELIKQKEDVKSLKFSADYLLSLINDILQISKLDSKQKNILNKTTFNIKELVEGILKSFEFLKAQNLNTFLVNFSGDVPKILIGDDVKLSQILINLIGNACKFTENGTIAVSISSQITEDKKAKIGFNIKDTGIGIPLSKQHKIFDEFSQIKNTESKYQGTGLGLPIVKKLLALHDAEINLVSEEGKGTEIAFDIIFEIAQENYNAAETIVHEAKVTIKNKTILVVDDNRINRIVTKKILEKYNTKPLLAEGGQEAIEIASKNHVDLILMDVHMPKMNGLEATEALRELNINVPIIALTAVTVEEMRERLEKSSMCDIIIKPFDEVVFVETINKHV